MTKNEVLSEIQLITSKLIKLSLSEHQNFPSEKEGYVYISGNYDNSVALRNLPYTDIYEVMESEKNYNIKMQDGALIQFMYTFNEGNLVKSRLTFFPSPFLEEYQNNAELYQLDEIYADIIHKNIVSTPIRFDFDPDNHEDIHHPVSHLTIGQYKNCRIPVSKPLSPVEFIKFILMNFYNTVSVKFSKELNLINTENTFENCITKNELSLLHLNKE